MVAPAVVIAAPASGSGKTTIATGLMGALARTGTVAPFKVGPDYIDPGYHALATGRAGRNLDAILCGEQRIAPLYRHGSRDADIAVVEGVMGLFDGRIVDGPGGAATEGIGSTADVAQILGAPVLLVVDARGHSQSLAALLAGFATYRPGIALAGVILNRVSSPRHERVLRDACAHAGLEAVGAVPGAAALEVPARHLGLIPAAERGAEAVAAVAAMTELVEQHVDVERIRALARPVADGPVWSPTDEVARAGEPVVALAGGPAFSFGYAEHEEMLRAAGARVERFDPLSDELPGGAAAVVLPGGFPEVYAQTLSANTALRDQLRALVGAGGVIHAECAGQLYLAESLDGVPMCGIVPGAATFTRRLTLGYRDAVALGASPLFEPGERVAGHEFHRTALAPGASPAWGWRDGEGVATTDGYLSPALHSSYLHVHPAGYPQVAERLVRAVV
ncbi:cobyrinate a,c-diamide synthase [Tsukamurella ocularis]|uniref:cobyrinate a,c-diamide synthase n=1 Tax=Tsukamurella ocularis TaxID=1970234 RepID=UPI00216733E8|nr:cobyrinate a,c-diamide synthase [Tsukamurella ocularis]MCS3780234.1 cobyrinic acid a,c-diamide synthase [Tsukamurella ocularis]MCS3786212.1 cobyrinic acid a,c-diamide synthase [Tsukamurella ocularis]MCS3849576.1 cobyrinic acid a,c-diamide synthase [Tsukamurella ocularis]